MVVTLAALALKSGARRLLPCYPHPSFRWTHKCLTTSTSDTPATDEPAKSPPAAAKPKQLRYVSEDVRKYFSSPELEEVLNVFPSKLFNKKRLHPDALYICHPQGAAEIAKHVLKDVDPQKPFVEINPGAGLLTRHLVESEVHDIRLYEGTREFMESLQAQFDANPKVSINRGDMLSMIKLSYLDRCDNAGRMRTFFAGLPQTEWTADVNFRLFGCVGSANFIKHLISSVVFQTNIMALGRAEMMLMMPARLYMHLTCDNSAGLLMYRSTTILFQIMFTHELIAKIPRKHFLPYQYSTDSKTGETRHPQDPENMYLVKIVPRRELFDVIPADMMPAFWFFVRHNCVSRSNRIIPNLEKFVPGAGIHLILGNTATPKPNAETTTPGTPNQISRHDYIDKINIFTTFGDLTPSQMLTLFFQFANMPGYKRSPFIAAMEMALMKMDANNDSMEESGEYIRKPILPDAESAEVSQ